MSDLGGYPQGGGWSLPPDPPPDPPPDRPPVPPEGAPSPDGTPGAGSSEVPVWVVGVAVAVALAMTGALVFALVRPGSHHVSAGPSTTHHASYPAHWDKRVRPEVRIAEKQRGLTFKHPVPVRFLSPAAFRKTLTTEDKVTPRDRKQLEQATGLLRAFGLLSGKVDLLKAEQDFSGSAVLAYYSFKTRSVTVRGHVITPSVKATLVHELTHVLQDQYFHVGARIKAFQKASAKAGQSGDDAQSVLHALTEGDAERVEHAYGASLGPAQRQALVAAQRREARQAQHGLTSVPPIIVTLESSPYSLGEGLVTAVDTDGGDSAVGRMFRHPPRYDAALLDPFRVIEGRAGALPVAAPRLGAGEQKFDSGDLGALTWYLTLAARLPALQALQAADGWGGDAFVGYRSGGRTCARVSYRGRTPTDTSTMDAALGQWIAAAPGSSATVTMNGGVLTFQSCDPGVAVQSVRDFQPAIDLVSTRTLLGITLMRAGTPSSAARCIADGLVKTYSVAQLTDPSFGAGDPTVQARIQQIAAGCR